MDKATEIPEIGHRELRERLAPLLKQLRTGHQPAAVTNRNRVEAFLVPVPLYDELARARTERDDLRSLVPLLIAAVQAGVAIPSETLAQAGIRLDFDWRKLNALQAAYPINITHDEAGRRLPSMPKVSHSPVQESDEELDLAP